MSLHRFKKANLLLAVFVLANVFVTLKIAVSRDFFNSSDFIAYTIGASMVTDGHGKELYHMDLQSSYWSKFNKYDQPAKYFLPFIAPATTGLLYIPYLLLDPLVGYRLAMLVNLTTVLLAIFVLTRAKPKTPLIALLMLSSWFLWTCVWQTQPTALMFLLIVLSLYLSDKREKLSIFLFLLALLIKPHYFLTATPLLFILAKNRMGFIKIFLLLLIPFVFLNLYIIGVNGITDYANLLISTDNSSYGNRWYEMYTSQSLVLTFLNLLDIKQAKPIALVLSIVMYVVLIVAVAKSKFRQMLSPPIKLVLVIQVMLFFSYHVLSQDMILTLIPLIILSVTYGWFDDTGHKTVLLLTALLGHITVSLLAPFYGAFLFVLVLYYLINLAKRSVFLRENGALLQKIE